ncbi:MAG TPA: hypothetical protein VK171_09265 [Fimbriimonas sp.]|nr:hypothetical protein [Fimbriimonas sp.]
MLLALVLFWILILWGIKSEDLYWSEALIFIAIWAILLALFIYKIGPNMVWIAGLILLDIVLIFKNGIIDAKAF